MSGRNDLIADENRLSLVLTTRLIEIYGQEKRLKDSGVIIPAILRDFTGVLRSSEIGKDITEVYRTEDGVVEIVLSTIKTKGGSDVAATVRRR